MPAKIRLRGTKSADVADDSSSRLESRNMSLSRPQESIEDSVKTS